MSTLYAILPRDEWDRETPVPEHPGAILVAAERLNDTITRLCTRNALAFASVRDYLRRKGSVYLAATRTAQYPGGVLVARLTEPPRVARVPDMSADLPNSKASQAFTAEADRNLRAAEVHMASGDERTALMRLRRAAQCRQQAERCMPR